MKISSASKKVLASALSAAMVVAFAPTVAFGAVPAADTATAQVTVTTHDNVTGAQKTYTKSYYNVKDDKSGIQAALDDVADGTIVLEYSPAVGTTPAVSDTLTLSNGNWAGEGHAAITVDKVTVTLLADLNEGITYTGSQAITIDLGGKTLGNDVYDADGNLLKDSTDGEDTVAKTTVSIDNGGENGATVTIKNGTINADSLEKYTDSTKTTAQLAVDAEVDATVTLEGITANADVKNADVLNGGTYKGVDGDVQLKGEVATGAITGDVEVAKGGVVTVATSSAKYAVTGIDGKVELKDAASLTVTASSEKSTATGIDASGEDEGIVLGKDAKLAVSATATYKDVAATGIKLGENDATIGVWDGETAKTNSAPVVTVEAATTSTVNDTKTATTTGIEGTVTVENGSLSIVAASADADGIAKGVKGNLTVQDKGTAEVTGSAVEAANSFAVDGTLVASAGKYTGKATLGEGLTGGSYTVKPVKDTNYNSANYEVTDDGTYWTISQFAGYNLAANVIKAKGSYLVGVDTDDDVVDSESAATLEELAAIRTAVSNALNGKEGAASFSYTEGNSLATLQAQTKQADEKQLTVCYTNVKYNAKTATEAEKAAYDAMQAWAADNKVVLGNVYLPSVFVGYKAKPTDTEYTVMAYVTGFGSTTTGRTTEDNVITFAKASDIALKANGFGMLTYSGTAASELAPVVDKTDADTPNHFAVNGMPFAYAQFATDLKAIQGGEGETPAPAPAEKSTQSISVDQKSLTVKLGAKKKATAKGKSFNMGATAETAITTAWKSGSTKITVSGDKVKLAKGAKRGTYTAKVSLKAAASDAYLAAAKTITVKFVIK